MRKSRLGTTLRAFCANCTGARNCEVKGHHRVSESDGQFDWWCDWYLLVCRGCDHVFAQSVSSDSESYYPVGYDRDGNTEYAADEVVRSWPARFKRSRPGWLHKLDNHIAHEKADDFSACLLQVYEALDHDLNILAAIGIRTAFDVASEILGVEPDQGFESKLSEMEKSGLITPSQKDEFDVLINAGNASAHRGWNPKFEDLDPLMDALEHFINDKFIAPASRQRASDGIAKVKPKVPSRPIKKKTKKAEVADGKEG